MSEIEALAEQIKALSPPDKLRLAADLLEARRAQTAYDVADMAVKELGVALALARRPK